MVKRGKVEESQRGAATVLQQTNRLPHVVGTANR